MEEVEVEEEIEEEVGEMQKEVEVESSFGFPVVDEETNATMKIMSPSVLPNIHGLKSEDPETFLFEFEFLCRTYDYLQYAQNLKCSLQH